MTILRFIAVTAALTALFLPERAKGQGGFPLAALPASFTLTAGTDTFPTAKQATGVFGSYAMTGSNGKWTGSNGGNTVTVTRFATTYYVEVNGPSGKGGNTVLTANGAKFVWRTSVGSSGTVLFTN